MVTIGCTLPLSLLSENPPDDLRELWQFGSARRVLTRLAAMGYAAVEWHAVTAAASERTLCLGEELCREAGLRVTFHGTLTASVSPQAFWAPYRYLPPRKDDNLYMVTVHGLDTAAATAAALTALDTYAAHQALPFRLALENDHRDSAETAATDSADGVARCLRGVSPRVGICWDIGHYEYNRRAGWEPERPSPAFLQRVVHTHLHGVTAQGMHQPLDTTCLEQAGLLTLLRETGYSGVWNIELSPSRFYRTRSLWEAFETSFSTLSAVLTEARC